MIVEYRENGTSKLLAITIKEGDQIRVVTHDGSTYQGIVRSMDQTEITLGIRLGAGTPRYESMERIVWADIARIGHLAPPSRWEKTLMFFAGMAVTTLAVATVLSIWLSYAFGGL